MIYRPGYPVCGVTFSVSFEVTNIGTVATPQPAYLTLVDTAPGATTVYAVGNAPVLAPNASYTFSADLKIKSACDQEHRLTARVDPANAIVETNEEDNVHSIYYWLQPGP